MNKGIKPLLILTSILLPGLIFTYRLSDYFWSNLEDPAPKKASTSESSQQKLTLFYNNFSNIGVNYLSPPVFNTLTQAINTPILDSGRKILFCNIPTNFDSHFKVLFCNLLNPPGQSTDPSLLDDPGKIRNVGCLAPLGTFYRKTSVQEHTLLNDPAYHKLGLIRDPIDRFLAGWLFHCHSKSALPKTACFGCGAANITCFAAENFKHLSYLSKRGNEPRGMSKWSPSSAFYPQFWFCNFENYLEQYKDGLLRGDRFSNLSGVKVDTFAEGFQQAVILGLNNAGVSATFTDAGWGKNGAFGFLQSFSSDEPATTDINILIQELIAQPITLDYIYRSYIIDYVSFHIVPPKWTIQSCPRDSHIFLCKHLKVIYGLK